MRKLFRRVAMLIGASALAGSAWAGDIPWRLDTQRSLIEIAVHATSDVFMCRISQFDAQIATDRATGQIVRAVLSFALSDAKTGQARRDADLLQWADYGHFSNVVFRLVELAPTADGGLQARGTITLHGVEKSVTFPVRTLVQGQLQSIDGETMLDFRDYGLPPIRKFLFVTVDPRLWVRFHVQGWLEEALDPVVVNEEK